MTATGTPTDTAVPTIRVRGLCKAFGTNRVLDGLDLDIAQGESLAVIGRSGTGKSVLVKNIVGLMRPDAGSIEIDGKETVGLAGPARDRILAGFGGAVSGRGAVRQHAGMGKRGVRADPQPRQCPGKRPARPRSSSWRW